MAIKPVCDICSKELEGYGAIVFSPPKGHDVKKYHVCSACYDKHLKKLLKLSDKSNDSTC